MTTGAVSAARPVFKFGDAAIEFDPSPSTVGLEQSRELIALLGGLTAGAPPDPEAAVQWALGELERRELSIQLLCLVGHAPGLTWSRHWADETADQLLAHASVRELALAREVARETLRRCLAALAARTWADLASLARPPQPAAESRP
jgi:hypothetical protein